jgi:hypothetical protein
MDAEDALCSDAQASRALRRDTVIYQGTKKKRTVSDRQQVQGPKMLPEVKGERGGVSI